MAVVEAFEFVQGVQQVSLVPDQGSIEQFVAASPDPAFHDRVGPSRQLHPLSAMSGHSGDPVLAENPSTLLRAVPGIMDLDQLGSAITALCIANDGCGMMARRVATTDIPRRDERPRAPATHADE